MNNMLNLTSVLEGVKTFDKLKNMFISPCNETYLFSMLSELSNMDEMIRDLDKRTFQSLLEAESKTKENSQFCVYFKEFKSIIDNFINKVNEMASRCIINIENIIDVNKDLIEDMNIVNSFTPFDMEVYEFKNLENKDVTKFKAKKLFKKEFDHIGTLMQDLGPIASDEAKLKIIAAVYNSFNKDMNEEFMEKCIEKILDDEEYDKEKSFSEQIYNLFRGEKQSKTIQKYDIQQAKANLLSYITYTEIIDSMVRKVTEEFAEIAECVGDMVYRNKACTMKIDTETDGVVNREYDLNTYSMNQFNIFMKSKSVQISQMCNLFMVALSIKMDSIVDFINQNKDILQQAKNSSCCSKYTDREDDNGMEPDTEIEDMNDDVEGEEPDDFDMDNDMEEPSDDDFEIEPGDEPVNDETPDEEPPKEPMDDLKESYFFAHELYNLEKVFEQEQMMNNFISIIREEEAKQDGQTTPLNNLNKQSEANSNKFVDIWRTIVEKLSSIFKKFYDIFIGKTKARSEYIVKHQKEINAGNFGEKATIKYYDINKLQNLKIPDLNYEAMKDSLKDTKTFREKYFNEIKMHEKTDNFGQAIKKYICPYDNQETLINSVNGFGKDVMYNFCATGHKTLVANVQNQMNIINKAQMNAKRIAGAIDKETSNSAQKQPENPKGDNGTDTKTKTNTKESVNYTADDLYFNEFTDPNGGVKNIKDNLMTYFKVCSQVLSNVMSLSNAAFNEYYRALDSLIGNKSDKPQDNNKQATGESSDFFSELEQTSIANACLNELSTFKGLLLLTKKGKGEYNKKLWQMLKEHKNQGFENIVNKTNNLDELLYLRQDLNIGLSQMKKIKERIHNCEKYGECEMTKKYYKNIEKMYLSHGVTEKDVDLYIKWTENEMKPLINEKIAEARKNQKNKK